MVGKSLTSSLQALKCSWNSFWAAERKQQKVCEWPSMLVFPITNLVASIHCCIRFAQTVNLPRNMILVVNWVENKEPGWYDGGFSRKVALSSSSKTWQVLSSAVEQNSNMPWQGQHPCKSAWVKIEFGLWQNYPSLISVYMKEIL